MYINNSIKMNEISDVKNIDKLLIKKWNIRPIDLKRIDKFVIKIHKNIRFLNIISRIYN